MSSHFPFAGLEFFAQRNSEWGVQSGIDSAPLRRDAPSSTGKTHYARAQGAQGQHRLMQQGAGSALRLRPSFGPRRPSLDLDHRGARAPRQCR